MAKFFEATLCFSISAISCVDEVPSAADASSCEAVFAMESTSFWVLMDAALVGPSCEILDVTEFLQMKRRFYYILQRVEHLTTTIVGTRGARPDGLGA